MFPQRDLGSAWKSFEVHLEELCESHKNERQNVKQFHRKGFPFAMMVREEMQGCVFQP